MHVFISVCVRVCARTCKLQLLEPFQPDYLKIGSPHAFHERNLGNITALM